MHVTLKKNKEIKMGDITRIGKKEIVAVEETKAESKKNVKQESPSAARTSSTKSEGIKDKPILDRIIQILGKKRGLEGRKQLREVAANFGVNKKSATLPEDFGAKILQNLTDGEIKFDEARFLLEEFKTQITLPEGTLLSLMENPKLEPAQIFALVEPFEAQIGQHKNLEEGVAFAALRVLVEEESATYTVSDITELVVAMRGLSFETEDDITKAFEVMLDQLTKHEDIYDDLMEAFEVQMKAVGKTYTREEVNAENFAKIFADEDVKDLMDFLIGSKSLEVFAAKAAGALEEDTINQLVQSPEFSEFMKAFSSALVKDNMGAVMANLENKDFVHQEFTKFLEALFDKSAKGEKLSNADKAFMVLVNKFDKMSEVTEPEKKSKLEKIGGLLKLIGQRLAIGLASATALAISIAPAAVVLVPAILAALSLATPAGPIILAIIAASFLAGFLMGAIKGEAGYESIKGLVEKLNSWMPSIGKGTEIFNDKVLTEEQKQAAAKAKEEIDGSEVVQLMAKIQELGIADELANLAMGKKAEGEEATA